MQQLTSGRYQRLSSQFVFFTLNGYEEMFEEMPLSDVPSLNIRGRLYFPLTKGYFAWPWGVHSGGSHVPSSHKEGSIIAARWMWKTSTPLSFKKSFVSFITLAKRNQRPWEKMAPGLLTAADKYLLEDLKSWCETHLIRQMSAENCLECLSLSTLHPSSGASREICHRKLSSLSR